MDHTPDGVYFALQGIPEISKFHMNSWGSRCTRRNLPYADLAVTSRLVQTSSISVRLSDE